jgi:hypothetical protein
MTNRRLIRSFLVAASAFGALSCGSSGSNVEGSGAATGAGGSGAESGGQGAANGDGGALASGGAPNNAGGAVASGGTANGAGGTAASSGGGSNAGSGGATSTGGVANADAGSSFKKCKRGIAANTAPGAAFSPAITWWYNWASQGKGEGAGIEFTPMIWGAAHLNDTLQSNSKFLLGFNEPLFMSQANLSAAQAAADWPKVEARAAEQNLPIVGPAMNFCGPADKCWGTNPYQYLKDFFAACKDCKVDYVAVHWYNCDLPSLKDYLEPGGSLEGFEQFGKPIWLTEFSCNGDASVADQEKFMRAAIPYLEASSFVYRYSWFSAGPIPNAELIKADGSPTDLGKVYMSLPQACAD